jgi:hypothetical protein
MNGDQQRALFRRAFQFTVAWSDVDVRPFTSSDLDENKSWVGWRAAKSLAEVLSAPYALDSFPPPRRPRIDLRTADNPHILNWWTSNHDEILRMLRQAVHPGAKKRVSRSREHSCMCRVGGQAAHARPHRRTPWSDRRAGRIGTRAVLERSLGAPFGLVG